MARHVEKECNRDREKESTEQCKNITVRFREWLAEILCHSKLLGWAAEHFEGDSHNLAGMSLHNSVGADRHTDNDFGYVLVLSLAE